MGCQIFFVLSSFGLCYSFSKEIPSWFSHMKRRISKLAIGYWGAILIHVIYRILVAIIFKKDIITAINIPGVIINTLFLNGFVPIGGINNTIVRGGWYVGTTVILYALFPLLYKIYFQSKNKAWKKYRTVIFSLAVFFITSTIVILAEFIHPSFTCGNNSFIYFSFVNQLTPFALGLILFDMSNRYHNTKHALLVSVTFWIIAIVLFFGNYHYSFVFCPSFVAAGFVFLYWYLLNNESFYNAIHKGSNILVRTVSAFGKISFSIYLTHSFIVYEFSSVCMRFLRPVYNNDLLWYILLLPFQFCFTYLVAHIYDKCTAYIKFKKRTAE